MTVRSQTQSSRSFIGPDARRNFIRQQGLPEPAAGTSATQYSALLFQPRIVGLWVVAGTIAQSPGLFFALAATLWWSAAAPRSNPFDALYNRTSASATGVTLEPAPAPRRFAQGLAGSFAFAIALSLVVGWRVAAFVLEAFFVTAIGLLVFGGFCLGSYLFHLLGGHADFARRTLPWGAGG